MTEQSRGGITWFLTAVSFAVMLLATAYVLRANWPAGGFPLLAWQAHAAALTTFVIELATRALKIQASARGTGVPLTFTTAAKVCLAGDFAAAVTPARSGAEPARFIILAEAGVPVASRFVILFLELFLEMLSLALVCGAMAIVFSGRGASSAGLLALVGGYSTFVLTVGVVGYVLSKSARRGPPPRWALSIGLRAGKWRGVQRALRQLSTSVLALRNANKLYMWLAFAGSVVHILCKVAALPVLVFMGAPDFPLNWDTLAPLVLWPLALFYGGVVVPAPGGGGFIEGAFALTLKDSIPAAVFAASLIWWRFYTFYLYIIIGGIAAGDAALRGVRRRKHFEDGSVTSSTSRQ